MIVLRLSRPSALTTAAVFEDLFVEELGSAFTLRRADSGAWWRGVLAGPAVGGSLDAAAARLESQLAGADFLAPDYEAALFVPLFLALRNRAGSPTRLLLVAHAPGAWALEWALMGRLLAPGDRIAAPSRSAADLIAFFDPSLSPFVAVLPHPMAPLAVAPLDLAAAVKREGAGGAERIVSLGRIHPTKLLHRAIEALAVLRARGRRPPILEIAGAPQSKEATSYLRSLRAKVRRLDLDASVRFVGTIHGRAAKARFLRGARALVNLSVTVEESFGKAPVEALGCGVPVLATRWNGLPETVGDGGWLVDVDATRPGFPADVAAQAVADGLEHLLDAPPSPEACRRQAERFAAVSGRRRYRAALDAAAVEAAGAPPAPPDGAAPAAPEHGLLSATAPLTSMSWRDAFAAYLVSCDDQLQTWSSGEEPSVVRLRGILLQGTRAPIESFLAGRAAPSLEPPPSWSAPAAGDFLSQVAAGALAEGAPSAQVACLIHLWQAGRLDDLRRGLDRLDAAGFVTPAVLALRAEAATLAGDAALAFDRARDQLDLDRDDAVTAFRLRQLARIARDAGTPERALPELDAWLKRFPDAPDSGEVWLEVALNAALDAALAGEDDGERGSRAAIALDHARTLLGESPLLAAVERLVVCAEAAAAVSD